MFSTEEINEVAIVDEQLEPMDIDDPVDEPERILSAIEFRDVHLSFDDKKVLDGVSFTVRRGETKLILGRSGGGKSTTIRLILGLLKRMRAQILIDGEDITDYTEEGDDGRPEEDRDGLPGRSPLRFPFGLRECCVPSARAGRDRRERGRGEVQRMLRFVDLEDAIDKMPIELSGRNATSRRHRPCTSRRS
jgi:phospholipid/cholesterol/gamma-HCH transport system ATP-binding protein